MNKQDLLDEQYDRLIGILEDQIVQLQRHYRIKIVAWIKKLDIPVKNQTWKENRNIHLQVLINMIQQNQITTPFDKYPPEGSLPRLNISHLPYPLRAKFNNRQKSRSMRKTVTSRSPIRKENNSFKHNCKSFNETSATKKGLNTYSNCYNLSTYRLTDDDDQIKETTRKTFDRKSTHKECLKISQQLEEDKILIALKKTFRFLCKNHQVLSEQLQYAPLMEQLVSIASEKNHNFIHTNLNPNLSENRINFNKSNDKPKDKIKQKNQQSQHLSSFINEQNYNYHHNHIHSPNDL